MAGDAIPLGARVIAIADAVDTWMRPAPDGAALSTASVVEKLDEEAGVQFDPAIVKLAVGLL